MTATPDTAGTVLEDVDPELTRSYADALLNATDADGKADVVLGELDELIDDVWRAQPQFASLLSSPAVPPTRKDAILLEAFEGRAEPVVLNFLRVLNRHGRLGLLPAIAAQARTRLDRRRNRRPVTVRSAVALDDGQKARLDERLGAMIGSTPVTKYEVHPELIGGLVVQVGDDLYDASIRTQLDRLRQRLVEEKAHGLQESREAFQDLS